jgi:hypothetical protein
MLRAQPLQKAYVLRPGWGNALRKAAHGRQVMTTGQRWQAQSEAAGRAGTARWMPRCASKVRTAAVLGSDRSGVRQGSMAKRTRAAAALTSALRNL